MWPTPPARSSSRTHRRIGACSSTPPPGRTTRTSATCPPLLRCPLRQLDLRKGPGLPLLRTRPCHLLRRTHRFLPRRTQPFLPRRTHPFLPRRTHPCLRTYLRQRPRSRRPSVSFECFVGCGPEEYVLLQSFLLSDLQSAFRLSSTPALPSGSSL